MSAAPDASRDIERWRQQGQRRAVIAAGCHRPCPSRLPSFPLFFNPADHEDGARLRPSPLVPRSSHGKLVSDPAALLVLREAHSRQMAREAGRQDVRLAARSDGKR